ncbi:hypothetical protein AVEN_140836-1 [Araneus ventricosus]|uniref:Uncharacterized protein n=1 Tax=Araneus ventricosus TaxID=182803 RepID=A0A4Y2FNA8_ARAVE|nr:hypothetical protein AVEN_140836-1 [Araneus ventricosus]
MLTSVPRRQARELSMRSCRHPVYFLLLMDSPKPHVLAVRGDPLDGWNILVPGVSIGRYPSHFTGLLKGIKRKGHSLGLGLKSGVISIGELLNDTDEEILNDFRGQVVTDIRSLTIKKDGNIVRTKHIVLTFNASKLPEFVKAAYICCAIKPYIPKDVSNVSASDTPETLAAGRSLVPVVLRSDTTAVAVRQKTNASIARVSTLHSLVIAQPGRMQKKLFLLK